MTGEYVRFGGNSVTQMQMLNALLKYFSVDFQIETEPSRRAARRGPR